MRSTRGRNWAVVIAVPLVFSAAVVGTVLLAGLRSPKRSEVAQTVVAPTTTPEPAVPTTATADSPESTTDIAKEDAPTTPSTFVYTVVQGDTLTGIAQTYGTSVDELVALNQLVNPDLLSLGQKLLIPVGAVGSPPPATDTLSTDIQADLPVVTDAVGETEVLPEPADIDIPTPTSSGPPLIEIGQVLGSGVLLDEVVVIRNRGGAASLEGWTLSDGGSGTFILPAVTLYPGASLRVHSRTGTNRPSDLFWGLVEAAWHGGALATLRDAEGQVVDTYIVP